jgi:hypothetical protein
MFDKINDTHEEKRVKLVIVEPWDAYAIYSGKIVKSISNKAKNQRINLIMSVNELPSTYFVLSSRYKDDDLVEKLSKREGGIVYVDEMINAGILQMDRYEETDVKSFGIGGLDYLE